MPAISTTRFRSSGSRTATGGSACISPTSRTSCGRRAPLDREALHRGTSVYLPDRVLPMLPEIISNNLASLQPHKVRYTKTAFIEFTAEGRAWPSMFIRRRSRVAAGSLTRRSISYLADREGWRESSAHEVHALLGRMHELAMILRARRFGRGALELTMKEVKVDLDKDGRVSGAHVVENTESHQIIEEFMLAANEAVAELLREAGFLFLRRVHSDPDPRKLEALNAFVAELGLSTESLVSRFALQKLLGSRRGQAGAARRQLRRAAQPCSGPSTARSKRGITLWPAIAIAISRRRFAAIPISRFTASSITICTERSQSTIWPI